MRISESCYSSLERLPERAKTDSFNIIAQKSVKCYGMSSDETASRLPITWGEITKAKAVEVKAEVEVDQMVAEEMLTRTSRNEVPSSYYRHNQTYSNCWRKCTTVNKTCQNTYVSIIWSGSNRFGASRGGSLLSDNRCLLTRSRRILERSTLTIAPFYCKRMEGKVPGSSCKL